MHRSSLFAVVCCALTITACSKPAPKIAETATGEIIPQAAVPAVLTLSDVAGKWNIAATPEWNDTLVTHLVLDATGDPATWTVTYPPNPRALPVRVVLSGDSLILDWGPYKSARKAGLQAVSHDVYRLRDGKLVGASVSHYVGAMADSVRRLRLEGTRAP